MEPAPAPAPVRRPPVKRGTGAAELAKIIAETAAPRTVQLLLRPDGAKTPFHPPVRATGLSPAINRFSVLAVHDEDAAAAAVLAVDDEEEVAAAA